MDERWMKDGSHRGGGQKSGAKVGNIPFFFPPQNGNEKGVVSLGILQGTRKLIKLYY
jgi:hypothetical protein